MGIEPERPSEEKKRLNPPSSVPDIDAAFKSKAPLFFIGEDDVDDDDDEHGAPVDVEVHTMKNAFFRDGGWDRKALFDDYLAEELIFFAQIVTEASARGLTYSEFKDPLVFKQNLNLYLASESWLFDGLSESVIIQNMDYMLQKQDNNGDDIPTRNGARSIQALFNNYLAEMTFNASHCDSPEAEDVEDYLHSLLKNGAPQSFKVATERYLAQTLDNDNENQTVRPTNDDAWADGAVIYVLPKRQDLFSGKPTPKSAAGKKALVP